jgi:hypothetical protein
MTLKSRRRADIYRIVLQIKQPISFVKAQPDTKAQKKGKWSFFWHELSGRKSKYQRQVDLPIIYDGVIFDEGLRLDVLAEAPIICELKALDGMNLGWKERVLIYFTVFPIKTGINRIYIIILVAETPLSADLPKNLICSVPFSSEPFQNGLGYRNCLTFSGYHHCKTVLP